MEYSGELKAVSIRLPIPLINKVEELAAKQGYSKAEFYRKCFSDGLVKQYQDARDIYGGDAELMAKLATIIDCIDCVEGAIAYHR